MNLAPAALPQHASAEGLVKPARLVCDALQVTDTQNFAYNLTLCRVSQDAAHQQLVLAQDRCNATLAPADVDAAHWREVARAGQLTITAQQADSQTFVQCVLNSVASGDLQLSRGGKIGISVGLGVALVVLVGVALSYAAKQRRMLLSVGTVTFLPDGEVPSFALQRRYPATEGGNAPDRSTASLPQYVP